MALGRPASLGAATVGLVQWCGVPVAHWVKNLGHAPSRAEAKAADGMTMGLLYFMSLAVGALAIAGSALTLYRARTSFESDEAAIRCFRREGIHARPEHCVISDDRRAALAWDESRTLYVALAHGDKVVLRRFVRDRYPMISPLLNGLELRIAEPSIPATKLQFRGERMQSVRLWMRDIEGWHASY